MPLNTFVKHKHSAKKADEMNKAFSFNKVNYSTSSLDRAVYIDSIQTFSKIFKKLKNFFIRTNKIKKLKFCLVQSTQQKHPIYGLLLSQTVQSSSIHSTKKTYSASGFPHNQQNVTQTKDVVPTTSQSIHKYKNPRRGKKER